MNEVTLKIGDTIRKYNIIEVSGEGVILSNGFPVSYKMLELLQVK